MIEAKCWQLSPDLSQDAQRRQELQDRGYRGPDPIRSRHRGAIEGVSGGTRYRLGAAFYTPPVVYAAPEATISLPGVIEAGQGRVPFDLSVGAVARPRQITRDRGMTMRQPLLHRHTCVSPLPNAKDRLPGRPDGSKLNTPCPVSATSTSDARLSAVSTPCPMPFYRCQEVASAPVRTPKLEQS